MHSKTQTHSTFFSLALKDGEGRLSKDAKKHYLQGLRDRHVPTNDKDLIKSIKRMLLNEDGDVASVQLQRMNPISSAKDVQKVNKTVKESEVTGFVCNFGGDSSSEEEMSEDGEVVVSASHDGKISSESVRRQRSDSESSSSSSSDESSSSSDGSTSSSSSSES